MKQEIEIDSHHGVGPHRDLYDHGPVTVIQHHDEDAENPQEKHKYVVFMCLDCGYTGDDPRMFMHEECDREANWINKTWREAVGDVIAGDSDD